MAQQRGQCLRPVLLHRGQYRPGRPQPGLHRFRHSRRADGFLVHRCHQGPHQAALRLDERVDLGRRTQARTQRREAGGTDRVRRMVGADVRDQRKQVSAVHGRVVEATPVPVPVGVQTATTAADHWAVSAGLAQPGDALFPGGDARVPGDHVEAVAEDVQPSFRGALVRDLQRVHLLVAAVGLNDHQASRPEPQCLGQALPATQRGDDGIEGPYFCWTAIRDPAVRDRSQPVRVLMLRSRPTGRWMVPGRMGQQEVNPGRPQCH